jgi:hypothetical protein
MKSVDAPGSVVPSQAAPPRAAIPIFDGPMNLLDVVLFAVSFYLLKQDVERVALNADSATPSAK